MRSMLMALVFGGLVNCASTTVLPPAQAQIFTTDGAAVTTYDVVDDFSRRVNTERSTWSYRHTTTGVRDGNYPLLPGPTVLDQNWKFNGKGVNLYYWHDESQFSGYPAITANQSGHELSRNFCCGDLFMPPHSIGFDAGTVIAVVSFRAPTTGTLLINYSFTHLDCHGGNGINYYVDYNGRTKMKNLATGLLKSSSCDTPDTTGSQVITNVRVKAGDRINFIADNNGDYTYDSSALTARITYTPDPPPPPPSRTFAGPGTR